MYYNPLDFKWFSLWRWKHWFSPKVCYRYSRILVITNAHNYTVWKSTYFQKD